MKKLMIISLLSAFSYFAQAQSTYHAFKVDLDLGYALPSTGPGIKGGGTFFIEPHYRLSDEFALGFRMGGAFLDYQNSTTYFDFSSLDSYSLTGDYYFMKGGFRPFIGVGVGVFTNDFSFGSSSTSSLYFTSGATRFGYFPRVGFEAGHFRLSATYNFAGNNSNYADFALGFFFGGGKKK